MFKARSAFFRLPFPTSASRVLVVLCRLSWPTLLHNKAEMRVNGGPLARRRKGSFAAQHGGNLILDNPLGFC